MNFKLFFVIFLSVYISSVSNADDNSCKGEYVVYDSGDTIKKSKRASNGSTRTWVAFNEIKANMEKSLAESGYEDIHCYRTDEFGTHGRLCCTAISASKKVCNLLARQIMDSDSGPKIENQDLFSKFIAICGLQMN